MKPHKSHSLETRCRLPSYSCNLNTVTQTQLSELWESRKYWACFRIVQRECLTVQHACSQFSNRLSGICLLGTVVKWILSPGVHKTISFIFLSANVVHRDVHTSGTCNAAFWGVNSPFPWIFGLLNDFPLAACQSLSLETSLAFFFCNELLISVLRFPI